MILFPYSSVQSGRLQETGPIFVHARECTSYEKTSELSGSSSRPAVWCALTIERNFIIDARVVNGEARESVIEELLQNPATKFLHVRSATRGCYTFGVERV